ncbi:MAG: O-antigen ligase family protein [Novosphingobium sp.]|nr:O-antigen ligase family protein [Novosphingobium sp.]
MTALRDAVLPGFLLLCLVLGGASGGGYLANLFLQLCAVGLIGWTLLTGPPTPFTPQQRVLLWFGVAICLVVLLQFLPLPLPLWEQLGGRGAIIAADRETGITPSPAFLTLMPHETLKSAVWMLPPFGLALAILGLGNCRAHRLAIVIVAVMALSVLVGASQLSGGGNSPWYFYRITNRGSAVGFFANANHFSTLLLVSLPFLAALVETRWRGRRASRVVIVAIASAIFGVALVGIFVNGSLTGYGLGGPVLAASAMILVPRARLRRFSLLVLLPAIAAGMVLVFSTREGRQMLAESSTLSAPARETIFANSWKAARDFAPTGSGIGSFEEIYRLYEDPAEVGPRYINHAHNDYLELLVETGLAGGAMLAAFLLWWGRRAYRVWHAKNADPFARAAVVATATILIHSSVDYPLRTAAISCIFSLSCALMTRWASGDQLLIARRNAPRRRRAAPATA